MKRLMIAVVVALAAAAVPGTALADPEFNANNCAGAVVSSGAGPGFGEAVSVAAHLQLVDNFGLANCGAPPRNNP